MLPSALPARSDPKGVRVVVSNEGSAAARAFDVPSFRATVLAPAINANFLLFIILHPLILLIKFSGSDFSDYPLFVEFSLTVLR
jgi:hypothetical protein